VNFFATVYVRMIAFEIFTEARIWLYSYIYRLQTVVSAVLGRVGGIPWGRGKGVVDGSK
jgi:hypothetical protein